MWLTQEKKAHGYMWVKENIHTHHHYKQQERERVTQQRMRFVKNINIIDYKKSCTNGNIC
jgi:hypothetical protein